MFHLSYGCTVFWGVVVCALASLRRMSESGHSSRHGSVGGGSGVSGDWNPPPGHKSIPSPARAAELEAEVK